MRQCFSEATDRFCPLFVVQIRPVHGRSSSGRVRSAVAVRRGGMREDPGRRARGGRRLLPTHGGRWQDRWGRAAARTLPTRVETGCCPSVDPSRVVGRSAFRHLDGTPCRAALHPPTGPPFLIAPVVDTAVANILAPVAPWTAPRWTDYGGQPGDCVWNFPRHDLTRFVHRRRVRHPSESASLRGPLSAQADSDGHHVARL